MTNWNQPTQQENTWLVEYQVCQNEIRSQSSTYWLIFSIFFGINTVTLGWLIKDIIENRITVTKYNAMIIQIICIVMIFLLILLFLWLLRTNYIMSIHRSRMLEIERYLNMRAKRIENALDNPNENNDAAAHLFAEHYRPSHWFETSILRGHWIALIIFCILGLSWTSLLLLVPIFDC